MSVTNELLNQMAVLTRLVFLGKFGQRAKWQLPDGGVENVVRRVAALVQFTDLDPLPGPETMTPKEVEAEFAAFTNEEILRQRSLATLAPQPSEIYDFGELVKVGKWDEVGDLVVYTLGLEWPHRRPRPVLFGAPTPGFGHLNSRKGALAHVT